MPKLFSIAAHRCGVIPKLFAIATHRCGVMPKLFSIAAHRCGVMPKLFSIAAHRCGVMPKLFSIAAHRCGVISKLFSIAAHGRGAMADGLLAPPVRDAWCQSFFFRVKKKVTPFPGLLLAEIWPLWKWTLFFTIERPSPVPPIFRLRPLSTL